MKGLGIVGAVVALPVIAAIALFAFGGDSGPAILPETERQAALTIQPDDYVQGNADSEVVVVEYLDYQCPACAAYHPVVSTLVDEFSESVAFVTRHFPLVFHAHARNAAYAIEAAANQGQRPAFADAIFADQVVWSSQSVQDDLFDSYAADLGLDMSQFVADRMSDEIQDRVQSQYETGLSVGVNATPSFYLNGEKLDNPSGLEDFRQTLIQAIGESQLATGDSADQPSVLTGDSNPDPVQDPNTPSEVQIESFVSQQTLETSATTTQ